VNAAGEAAHSCVYLADDIVYTKNGENLLSPCASRTCWISTRISLDGACRAIAASQSAADLCGVAADFCAP